MAYTREKVNIILGIVVLLACSATQNETGLKETDVNCPWDAGADVSTYFPVPGRCNQFYECRNGVPVLLECSPGTLWSQKKLTCDWPQNVDCDGGNNDDSSESSGGDENNSNGNIGNDEDNNNSAGGDDNNNGEVLCPFDAGANHATYFPFQGRCDQFWECSNGKPVLMTCSVGTLWNQDKLTCDWPQNVECDGGNNDDNSDSSGGDENNSNGNVGNDEDNNNSAGGDDNNNGEVLCPFDAGANHATYFPVQGRCDQFWECSNGKPVLMTCSVGTLWNQGKLTCDWSENVVCDGSTTYRPSSEPTTSEDSIETTTSNENTGEDNNNNSDESDEDNEQCTCTCSSKQIKVPRRHFINL